VKGASRWILQRLLSGNAVKELSRKNADQLSYLVLDTHYSRASTHCAAAFETVDHVDHVCAPDPMHLDA